MTNAANSFAAFEACLPAAYEVSCRIRTGSPTSFWLDSPRTVASRHSIGSPVPRRRGLGRQAATRRRRTRVYVFACGCQSRPYDSEWPTSCSGSRVVMRTLFAAIAILTISGLLPAMASLDSCATKPCCAHAAVAIDTHPSCCETTTGSMTASPVALTQRSNVRDHPIVVTSTMITPLLRTSRDNDHRPLGSRAATRPPGTIAILLI